MSEWTNEELAALIESRDRLPMRAERKEIARRLRRMERLEEALRFARIRFDPSPEQVEVIRKYPGMLEAYRRVTDKIDAALDAAGEDTP